MRAHRIAMMVVAAAALAPTGAGAKGIPASGVVDLASGADAALVGGGAAERTGFAVAQVGDVNGDGHPDVAVSAPDASPSGRAKAGEVTIVFGPVSGRLDLATAPGLRIDGAAAGDQLGTAVAPAGDVDGDGHPDILIGAPGHGDGGAGAAYVVRGRADAGTVDLATDGSALQTVTGAAAGDALGTAVAGLGDTDGDGVPDLGLGAPGSALGGRGGGAVFVIHGARGGAAEAAGALGTGGWSIAGPEGAGAGLSVDAAGDVDGDGLRDVALGAPGLTVDGRAIGGAFVVRGRAGGAALDLGTLGAPDAWRFTGHAGDLFGAHVASAGDVDGDGHPDLIVGAPFAAPGGKERAGSAFILFSGAAGPQTVAVGDALPPAQGLRIDGANPGELTGAAVRGLGDIDGDRSADVVVTAPFASALGRDGAGVAYVIRAAQAADPKGRDPVVVTTSGLGAAGFRVVGPGSQARLYSATAGGDLDGDGAPDLLLGAVAPGGRASGGGAYAVFAPQPVAPAPPLPPDPGAQEEVGAGCRAAQLVEVVIDDSGSMADTDPDRLRARAVSLLLAKPRNIGKQLGAVEFGDLADEVFPPQAIRDPATDTTGQARALTDILDRLVQADNGGTDYNAGFTAAGSAAPRADARIFLTDGEHNAGEYLNGHRGGPPTYVVGLQIGRKGEAAERLARIAGDTRAKYFPNVRSDTLQPVFNAIDSKLNCDVGLDAFVDSLSDDDTSEPNVVDLDDDTHSADVSVSWDDEDDRVTPGDIELLDGDGKVVGRVTARMQRLATSRHPGRRLRFGPFTLRGLRGRTFYSLRINGVHGSELRIRTATARISGKRVRVHTQVTQSRRRR